MKLKTGAGILALFAAAALLAPHLAPYDPDAQDLLRGLQGPDAAHPMGLDLLGRDIFSRVVYGTRVSLAAGLAVTAVCALAGIMAGAAAGALGGKTDMAAARLMDMAQAFPGLLLAIGIMAVLGPGFGNLLFALCLTGWVGFARLTRAQILSLRERDFVAAAVSSGAGYGRLVFLHYLPNAAAPLLVEATFQMAGAITAEAGLSFLGLGVQPPAPSWGAMLNEGRPFLLIAPHLTAFPGACLVALVLAVNLAGDALRDRWDLKAR